MLKEAGYLLVNTNDQARVPFTSSSSVAQVVGENVGDKIKRPKSEERDKIQRPRENTVKIQKQQPNFMRGDD